MYLSKMHRREFHQKLLTGLAAVQVGGLKALPSMPKRVKRIKPARLKQGDLIGLITPGSFISDEALQKTVQNIEGMGFRTKLSANIRAERGFIAGTDRERLDDLHSMFADKEVAGVWCARGGYGCSRLLPGIDYALIKKYPKVLIGYSDITALIQAIHGRTGLICFHGPVGASDFNDYTKAQCLAVVVEGRSPYTIPLAEGNQQPDNPAYTPFIIQPGQARGILAGGNLSLLAALAGTPFDLDPEGKLLFIEEIGEKPYRIDRMLTQLRQAWPLHKATGIALGIFEDCQPEEGDRSLSLPDTLIDRTGDLNLPVAYGLSFGHIKTQCTLPVGIEAAFDAGSYSITLMESAVE